MRHCFLLKREKFYTQKKYNMDQNIATVVFIAVSLLVFFGYVGPTYSDVKTHLVDKEKYEKAKEDANKLIEKRAELGVKYESFLSYKDEFDLIVPLGRDDARTLMDLGAMADAYNILLTNVRVSDGAGYVRGRGVKTNLYNVPYNPKTIDLEFSATYLDFQGFLRSIQRSKRVFDPIFIEFASTEANVYNFKMGIHSYWITN